MQADEVSFEVALEDLVDPAGAEQQARDTRVDEHRAPHLRSCDSSRGYGVVREFVGHGVGRFLHEDPQVPNYGQAGMGALLRVGMCIAIEPMLNMGDWRTRILEDDWTVVTADGKLSAHFEHSIAITENGPEVLTAHS